MSAPQRLLLAAALIALSACTQTTVDRPFGGVSSTLLRMKTKAYSHEDRCESFNKVSPKRFELWIYEGYTSLGIARYRTTITASPKTDLTTSVTVFTTEVGLIFNSRFEPKEQEWLRAVKDELSKNR